MLQFWMLLPVGKDFISEGVWDFLVFKVKSCVDRCPSDLSDTRMAAEH